jgi:hypothetical protein
MATIIIVTAGFAERSFREGLRYVDLETKLVQDVDQTIVRFTAYDQVITEHSPISRDNCLVL